FDHKIPPESFGQAGYASLTRSGVSPFGVESANDYAVVQARAGDVAAWGFKKAGGTVQTSSIVELTARFEPFLKSGITATERKALTKYTSNAYREINAAWTGRDKNP